MNTVRLRAPTSWRDHAWYLGISAPLSAISRPTKTTVKQDEGCRAGTNNVSMLILGNVSAPLRGEVHKQGAAAQTTQQGGDPAPTSERGGDLGTSAVSRARLIGSLGSRSPRRTNFSPFYPQARCLKIFGKNHGR